MGLLIVAADVRRLHPLNQYEPPYVGCYTFFFMWRWTKK